MRSVMKPLNEVAVLLGVSTSKLRKICQNGEIKAEKRKGYRGRSVWYVQVTTPKATPFDQLINDWLASLATPRRGKPLAESTIRRYSEAVM
jgi:hypothetical protein